jgi:hypothetical protein
VNRISSRGAIAAVVVVLLAAFTFLRPLVAAQGDDRNAPPPSGGAGDVIAQGIAELPAGPVAWRVVQNEVAPLGEGETEGRALGFLVALDDAILISDDNGARTRLTSGEAAFTAGGANQRWEGLGDGAAQYLRIALVPVSEANDAAGGTMILAGDGFDSPGGDHDVDLTSLRLAPQQVERVASDLPTVVYVLDGEAEVAPDGSEQLTPLAAGEAMVVDGGVNVRAEVGAHLLVASIGPVIPTDADVGDDTPLSEITATPGQGDDDDTGEPEGAGQIVVIGHFCPEGVTAEQAQDTSAGDPCFGGSQAAGMVVTAIDADGESYSTTLGDQGSAVLGDLPAGSYQVIFDAPTGYHQVVGVCGGQDSSADLPVVAFGPSSVQLELPGGKEYLCDTRVIATPGSEGDQGDGTGNTGSIGLFFYICEPGVTVDSFDATLCAPAVAGFDVTLQGPTTLNVSNVNIVGGAWVWDDLPLDVDVYSIVIDAYPVGTNSYLLAVDENSAPFQPGAGGLYPSSEEPNVTRIIYFVQE